MTISYTSAQYKKRTLREVALGYDNANTSGQTNEVQVITITGTPVSGTLTVTFGGQTTAAIPYNATAVQVEAALEALTTIQPDNVTVTGGPGPGTPWTVTFTNALGGTNVAAMTTTDSLGGGTSPASAVTTSTPGVRTRAMVYIPINSRGVGLSPSVQTIVTQGTIERFSDDEPQNYSITIDQDVYENAMNDMWLAKTTTGLTDTPFTLAARYHISGTPDQDVQVEVRLKVTMYNINAGTERVEYIRFPKCRPQQYNPLGTGAQAETLIPQQVMLDASRTLTDLTGVLVAGAVAPGDFAVIDVVS